MKGTTSFRYAVGCNKIEGLMYLYDGAYILVVFSFKKIFFNKILNKRSKSLHGLTGIDTLAHKWTCQGV